MFKIDAYKTADGKVFENKQEAQIHEANMAQYKEIEDFVSANCYSGMNISDIVDMLIEHKEELREIFNIGAKIAVD